MERYVRLIVRLEIAYCAQEVHAGSVYQIISLTEGHVCYRVLRLPIAKPASPLHYVPHVPQDINSQPTTKIAIWFVWFLVAGCAPVSHPKLVSPVILAI